MPAGALYVIATPIGNLGDASPRVIESLGSVDVVACEDTRYSRPLLAHFGISARTVALHQHNERPAAEGLIKRIQDGSSVALISDAGTPGVSDPGAILVELAHKEKIRVVPVPGPSAAIAAFSASGFSGGRFMFAGFLPSAAAARRAEIAKLDGPYPLILYEAPHRILKTVTDLAAHFGATREIVIARELSKMFEEIARMPLGEACAWVEGGPHRQQGEFVIVLGPGSPVSAREDTRGQEILDILLEVVAPSEAARIAARITGAPRNQLYRDALEKSHRKIGE